MVRVENTFMSRASQEIAQGKRFQFGENWSRFLTVLTDERIKYAERSLVEMLGVDRLEGKRFVDVGSGSGLFSLAARNLGARVYSFDYDHQAVACTAELKRRYFADDRQWEVDHGSVLDLDYLTSLGTFEVVYSWGVLHHTGAMWQALANTATLCRPAGQLFVAIYNDQGARSLRWRRIKRLYNQLPRFLRAPYVIMALAPSELRFALSSLVKLQPGRYVRDWTRYQESSRGMSRWRNMVDWVGGYPFEVATPEDVLDFFRGRGFELTKLKTCGGGWGCNEFVFARR